MKKRILSLIMTGLMLLSLSGCGEQFDCKGGNPWINSDIEENVKNNYDTDLKDDFALAINKDWVLNNPIEEGRAGKDYLSSFEDELLLRLKGIASDDSYEGNHDAELVSAYYNAFLDWDSRNAAGVEPVKPYLEEINAIESMDDLYEYSSKARLTISDVYGWSIYVSPEDSTRNIVYISAPEIFLNDAADYENLNKMDSYTKQVYEAKSKMVKAVLSRCGYSDKEIDSIFKGAIEFERIYSQYCYTNDDYYLTETTDILNSQLYTPEELSKMAGTEVYFNSFENWGLTDVPQIQLYEKMDYFEHLADIYNEENLELMKDYLLAHTAASSMGKLDKELYYECLDIVNELNGSTGYLPEEEIAISKVSNNLGWPLSKLYCDKYVTEEDKQEVYDIISDIIDEYKVMISEEEFMSAETKANAINKLDNMAIKCMYPEEWYDYSGLELSGSYFDMNNAITEFEIQKMVNEFNDPVDRFKWTCTPITVNAFYSSTENSINILPGLIGDVLYNKDMEKEEVYAMLGVVIGHEISHAFDPNGAMYDETGNFNNWWTEEDYERFDSLTQKLVAYYDNITIWKDFNCNGEMVKGEACADMAGVACVLRLAKKDPDFDYDLFFRSYARLWASNTTANAEYSYGAYDEHPLSYLRTNVVVAQFDEFYETYDIKEGDGMYIAPEDRVKIW